jgi:hypothetical protein
MFSAYSWGDFVGFVLGVALLYYGYVFLRYYWEDIRDWWANRRDRKPGEQPNEQPTTNVPASLYAVNDYRQSDNVSVKEAEARQEPVLELAEVEPELDGPLIPETTESVFTMPLVGEVVNPAEQSLAELSRVAETLTADEAGRLVADEGDPAAVRLAAVINNQQGRTAFADIPFSR